MTGALDRSGCPADRHGEYWMAAKLGCVCFDTRVDNSRYRQEVRAGRRRIVPAVAAIRIAQGLARHGFTADDIAAMAGVSLRLVRDLQAGTKRQVFRSRDAQLRAAADRVRLDVARTGYAADRARAAARRHGWAPLTAWDDDALGDPQAQPALGMPDADVVDELVVEQALAGERVALNDPERALAVRMALARGLTVSAAAELLRMNVSTTRSFAETGLSPRQLRLRRLDAAVEQFPDLSTPDLAARLGVARETAARSRRRLAGRNQQIAS